MCPLNIIASAYLSCMTYSGCAHKIEIFSRYGNYNIDSYLFHKRIVSQRYVPYRTSEEY